MAPSIIKQFTEADEVTVTSVRSSSAGNLVGICQLSGSMSFHFHMTPAQARELADALISHADDVEKN